MSQQHRATICADFILWILLFASVACAGWGLLVYNLTPMLVHDTLHGVGQLNDAQRDVLYPALLKAYRVPIFGAAGVSLGWIVYAVIVHRSRRM